MTISTTTNRVDFAGNDVTTTPFATGFKFYADTDLSVILVNDTTGAETAQVLTTDYSVTGAGEDAGGTVTMVTAPATGETLVIVRAQPYTQGLDLVENDEFPSNSVEETLDKITIMAQQNRDSIDRSVQLAEGFTGTFDPSLPPDIATANATVVVNAAGDGFDVGPTTTEIADAEAEATAAAASAAAAATSETNAATSENNAAASAEAAAASAVIWCGTATGTADALVLTPASAITSYVTGSTFRWQASANANTGAATVAISGLAAKALEIDDAALTAGDIEANKYYSMLYDGTAFQVTPLSADAVNDVLVASDIGSSVQGYDADTAKTDVKQAYTNQQYFTPQSDSQSGAVLTIDFDTGGNYTEVTLTEAVTTMTLNNMEPGGVYKIRTTGAYTITGWAADVVNDFTWPSDTEHTFGVTEYTMVTIEAGNTTNIISARDYGA